MDQPGERRGPDRLGLHALPIRTKRLILRRLRPDDASTIQPLVAERAVAEFTENIPHPYPPDGAVRWIAESEQAIADGTRLTLAIERQQSPGAIGGIGCNMHRGAAAEIGFWLGVPYWGQGYMTEAVQALVAHGFARMNLRSIDAAAAPANVASIRVQEKAGFVPAGRIRRHAPARGREVEHELRRLTVDSWRAANPAPLLLVTAVALVDGDGRVLIAQRPAGKTMAGLWEFPGGKVAADETPERALVRELAEEIGVDTYESCLAPIAFASHRYETFHLLMPLYVCRVWKGTPSAREGQTLAWVQPVRLGDYPMPPADIPLVAQLRDIL